MYLRDIGVGLPDRTVSSGEVAAWTGADPSFLTEKIGISERRFLNKDESTLDLAYRAVVDLLDRNRGSLDVGDIDVIVVVTQNPDFQLPHTSAILQDRIGAGDHVAAFDISLGCSGWVYGLAIVQSLLAQQSFKNGIVVTADPYSRSMRKSDKNTITLFGDGAAATWLCADQGAKLGEFVFGTDGSKFDSLIIRRGGAKHPLCSIDSESEVESKPTEGLNIHMEGRDILQFMLERVPGTVEKCLQKNNLTHDDIDFFLFHQASKYMISTLARRMKLDPERVPINIDKIGNTVSSTIPILTRELMDTKRLDGKKALACGFGVGLSWASTVVSF